MSRTTLTLGALVGFVTLFGITARNASMLLSHHRHLEEVEKVPFGSDDPVAIVLAGGLLSSTALTLVLLPAFYLRWGKIR